MIWITKEDNNQLLEQAKEIFSGRRNLDAIEFIPGKCVMRDGTEYTLQYIQMVLMELPPISLMINSQFEKIVAEWTHELSPRSKV